MKDGGSRRFEKLGQILTQFNKTVTRRVGRDFASVARRQGSDLSSYFAVSNLGYRVGRSGLWPKLDS